MKGLQLIATRRSGVKRNSFARHFIVIDTFSVHYIRLAINSNSQPIHQAVMSFSNELQLRVLCVSRWCVSVCVAAGAIRAIAIRTHFI